MFRGRFPCAHPCMADTPVPPALAAHAFKPGKSGNPLGRPKGAKGFAKRAREALFEPGAADGESAFEKLCEVARSPFHDHWPHAIKLLVGRAFGKELSLVELTGKDGSPLFGQLTDE